MNSNSRITIQKSGTVQQLGNTNNGEAINVHGYGNTVVNYGTIHSHNGAALWFQDEAASDSNVRNTVINYGTISTDKGAGYNVFGSSKGDAGGGLDFRNYGNVLGSLRFGRGDDSLTFGTGSYITGNVDGGGGTNDLTLDADLNKSGTLQGGVANFSSITKTGQGGWSILGQIPVDEGGGTYPPGGSPVSGALAHITKIMVNEGLLSIAGAAPDFTGAIEVSSPGRLSVQAQSINNNTGVRNYGNLVFDQPFNDAYTGAAITGSGMVIKQGTGDLTMNANGVNTYTGGTWIAEGALVVDADTDLGAATGVVLLGTDNNRGNLNGVLKFASSFDLATTRAIDLRDGGGTFDTNGFNTTIAQTVSGTGGLTKAGAGVLELHGINTYQGPTEVKGGTLGINSDTSLGKSGTRLVLYDSTTLRLDANTGLMNRPVSLVRE